MTMGPAPPGATGTNEANGRQPKSHLLLEKGNAADQLRPTVGSIAGCLQYSRL